MMILKTFIRRNIFTLRKTKGISFQILGIVFNFKNLFLMKRKKTLILTTLIILALVAAVFWPEKELSENFLATEISKIEKYLDSHEILNKDVSEASLGWHLDHVLLVVNSIYGQLEASDPGLYKSKINKIRTLVFTINGIPRGRGESPNRVRPKDDISKQEILNHLAMVREIIYKFDSLPKRSHFAHPYFGMLDRKQSKKFIKIHTNHHLKIVKDMLNKK